MLLMSLLSSVSHCMSDASVHIGRTWLEPVNLFSLALSLPGGGKSLAINKVFLEAVREIEKEEKEEDNNIKIRVQICPYSGKEAFAYVR